MADAPERDILIAARKLIERPTAWVQGTDALDKVGNEVSPYSRAAVRLCPQAALLRAADTTDIQVGVRARDRFRSVISCLSIPRWNDAPERTHADVLAAFDRAVSDA